MWSASSPPVTAHCSDALWVYAASVAGLSGPPPSSHSHPPLQCQEVLYFELLPVSHRYISQTTLAAAHLLLPWGLVTERFVMPVNTCITDSATATCSVGELPTNRSPVSLRRPRCCRVHRNEQRSPVYSDIASVLRAIGWFCHWGGKGKN